MLAVFIFLELCAGGLHGRMYHERFDKKMFPSKSVCGIVQSASRYRIVIQVADEPGGLKDFPTHRRLSQGMYSYRANDPIAYTVSDVRPGDLATLYICREHEAEYCFAISIDKRPGGLIPNSHNPKPFAPYAERQNASNLFADTGSPIPRHLVNKQAEEYPFADPSIPKEKRPKRFPQEYPFSYMEYLLFMR